MDLQHPENSEGYLGGGNQLRDYNGRTVYSQNITPDKETGIGNWTEAQFIRAVRDGFRPDNTPIRYPMERYNEFTDDELAAVYAYLRTVPPLHNPNKVSEEIKLADANASLGKKIYYKYACTSCHGETGVATCDLRPAASKYQSNDSLIAWIRDPSKYKPDTKMPTWNGVIKEEEYLPLAEYVRQLGERSTTVATR
jgi:cytochrome c2